MPGMTMPLGLEPEKFGGGPCSITFTLVFESEAPTRVDELAAMLEQLYGDRLGPDVGLPPGGSEAMLRWRVSAPPGDVRD